MKRAHSLSAALALFFGLSAWPLGAALTSGVYQTLPGATVVETSGSGPNASRVVPISAILTFDLEASPPSLTVVMPNAVLEHEEPGPLTVRSLTGARLGNGAYSFSGDYLRELYPSGTQYGFDWNFTASTNGGAVWDGVTQWLGGRIWYVTISNVPIVPVPRLDIARAGSKVTLSWPATYTGFALEQADALPADKWAAVKGSVELMADRFSVTIEAGAAQGYFRLRRLN